MSRKGTRLILLLAVLVLVLSASSSAYAGGCFSDCWDRFYHAYCGGLPPGPDQQMCAHWILEVCNCQCYPEICN